MIIDLLHGATIVDENVFCVQGGGKQFFEWNECGFSLHIPEGALLATETCPVAVKALVAGNFQFPKHTQLISGLYAISAARECKWCVYNIVLRGSVIIHCSNCPYLVLCSINCYLFICLIRYYSTFLLYNTNNR